MKKLLLLLIATLALTAKPQTIVFGAGCFWGVEKYFDNLEGVINARSGYAGGSYANPSYKEVLKHRSSKDITNHTEVVEVVYDDANISTQTLIEHFWELHDPTQGERQGADRGNNYRSALYYVTDEQKKVALSTKERYQKLLSNAGYGEITTEIKKLEKFYPAERYHQDYLAKNPNGYCPNHATGVKFKRENSKKEESVKSISPLGGKEIVVVEKKNCRFCEKLKQDVLADYKGSIPLRTVDIKGLKGFDIKSGIRGTPTIFFIEDGKEKESYTGYIDEKEFYQAVGAFKLGRDSEGYSVAFKKETDGRFCKQYKKFKNTGDGVFIDKISGEVLFDTKERFNSGSGWLSFFSAVDGAVIERVDNSLGMKRVEIIAKKSGAHLGHVFNDAPNGKRRFCINATVLEFVPRDEVKR